MRILPFLSAMLAGVPLIFAQSDVELRQYFEGRTVLVKVDMPASSEGVDVRPNAAMPIDFRKVASDVKRYGTGVHEGDRIMISKVLVKKDHIEFHLGGGGFGTFADRMRTAPTPVATYQSKSRREKDLEDRLKWATGHERTRIKNELDDLQRDRIRDNTVGMAVNAQLRQQQEANIREERRQDGSRFNIRYGDGFAAGATTPEGIMSALAQFVDFPEAGEGSSQPPARSPAKAARTDTPPAGTAAVALRKGMTVAQVEQLLGPADEVSKQEQNSLEIVARQYSNDGQRVSTKFVGGVLVDFTATAGNR